MELDTDSLYKKNRRDAWKRVKKAEAGRGAGKSCGALEDTMPSPIQYTFIPPALQSREPELWRKIPGIPFYYASTLGRVCFVDGGLVSQATSKYGWATVSLRIVSVPRYRNGYGTRQVHRLVAETFIPNPIPGIYTRIAHVDGNKQNNRVSNLMWMAATYSKFVLAQTGSTTDFSLAAGSADNTHPSGVLVTGGTEGTPADSSLAAAAHCAEATLGASPAGARLADLAADLAADWIPAPEVWLPLNEWHEDNFTCFVDPMRLTGHFLLGDGNHVDPFSTFCGWACAEDTQVLPWPLPERQVPLASA
jgi:hypothetical protein